jgi:hypothetical protein
MKMKWIFYVLFGLPFVGSAQQVTSSAGGIYTSPTGSMSMVVGQFNYENQGRESILTGGVLQVYLQQAIAMELNVMNVVLWPNPVKDDLFIKMNGEPAANLRYQVYDLKGRLLSDLGFDPDDLRIPMSQHPAGTYLILLTLPNQIPVPFKIIKL